MRRNIISLNDVWKTYKMGEVYVNALQGLNFKVDDGEFIAIQGPSGSGKSTAMNLIGCLDRPTKGTILLEGRDIAEMSESELSQIRGRKIGFVFQTFNLINTLTALENVMLPMTFQNVPVERRRERAKNLLNLVGLSERINHKPTELSGGEQQRIAIARSLVNDPDIVLADEPTGNLDSKTGEVIIKFLKKLNEERKKTIVIVTHDEEIAHLAQRIDYLKDGKIIKSIKR